MRHYADNFFKILIFSIFLSFISVACALAESKANTVKVLYVLTSEYADFDNGELRLKGIPAVLHFSDRKMNESGYMSVEDFVAKFNQYSEKQDNKAQSAALSIYSTDGADNVILQFESPLEVNGTLRFHTQVLQGQLPRQIATSTLFIVMLEPDLNGNV